MKSDRSETKIERPTTKLVDPAKIREQDAAAAKNLAIQIGVVAVIAVTVYLLFRYRMNATADARNDAEQTLAMVRTDINQYRLPEYRQRMMLDSSQILEDYQLRNQQLDTVAAKAGKDAALNAQVLLARGDLNWQLQDMISASTEPSTGQTSAADMLKNAQEAYAAIVSKYPDQHIAVAAAHLGLSAVAQNLGQWDEATNQCNAVANDADAPSTMKLMAKLQLAQMDKARVPIAIHMPAPSTQPASDAHTPSLQMGPFDASATRPVPEIINATTLPVTQP